VPHALVGFALLAFLTACAAPSAQDIAIAPGTVDGVELLTDCRTYPQPTTLEDLDQLAATSLDHPGFQGGDGAMSIELGDGRRLALFGDTLRDRSYPGGSFVRNSMMIFDGDQACVLTGPDGREVVNDRDDGVGYWPMSLVARSSGGIEDVAIMMQRVATTPSDDLGFVILGTSLVRMRIPHEGAPRVLETIDLQADDPSRSRTTWGAAMWRGDDGWIYVFGTRNPQRAGVYGWSLHAARARWGDLADQDQWQFWDGERWSSQRSQVATLIGADGGVAQVLSVFARDDAWYAVSTKDGDLGDEIVVWDAPTPTGPYSPHEATLHTPPDRLDGRLAYLVSAHPDLFVEPNSVVVSYSRGSANWDALVARPLEYRPRFVRVPLPR